MKKEIIKKLAVGILCSTFIMSSGTAFAADLKTLQPEEQAITKVSLDLNGTVPNTQGVLYQGKAWVPLRVAADGLGMKVQWDEKTRTATLDDGVRTMTFQEEDELYASWPSSPDLVGMTAPTKLAGAPYIAKDGRMWVPAEAFEVLVGYDVTSDQEKITIQPTK